MILIRKLEWLDQKKTIILKHTMNLIKMGNILEQKKKEKWEIVKRSKNDI
mgnify:CR=1 FL=1